FWVVLGVRHQDADSLHLVRLLRPRREWPRGGSTAEKRDELAPPHSTTSSAISRKSREIVRPSAFAVLRLMISSNFVGACTGRSAGFSPLRMRSIYPAAKRNGSLRTSP